MKYDVNEYTQINDIRTTAQRAKQTCDDQQESKKQSVIVYDKIFTFKNYVQYLPRNDKVIMAAGELEEIARELKDKFINSDKVSSAFCKIKFQSIESSAETMQKTIGNKPK
jgi:hypothetical protein